MSHTTTHILYEWTVEYKAELPGGRSSSSHDYRSLIIHQLDDPAKFSIPTGAVQTPVYYSGYLEKWFLANGTLLELPFRVHLFKPEEIPPC